MSIKNRPRKAMASCLTSSTTKVRAQQSLLRGVRKRGNAGGWRMATA